MASNSEISGFIIVSIAGIIMAFIIWLIKQQNKKDSEGDLGNNPVSDPIINQILFSLENNSDEEIWVDLMRLDPNDTRYKFNTSDGNYPMLVEYLKTYSFNVVKTSVNYQHDNWQSDILYNYSYSPFGVSEKPIFIGFHNFDKNQQQRNFISNNYEYSFDFFNTIAVKLAPQEKKAITMDIDYSLIEPSAEKNIYPKCALLVKNNSDETKKIKLFDQEFYNQYKDCEYIQSVFGQVSYAEVLKHFNSEDVIASKIKMFIGKDNADSSYTLNFDEHKIIDKISDTQEQDEVVEIDLGGETFIAVFEVELKPNTQMYVSIV